MSDTIAETAAQVRRYWRANGVGGRPIADDEIAAVERRAGALLPEYRTFLQVAGTQRDHDEFGILFWAPGDVRSMREVLGDGAGGMTSPHEALAIADYFQESWWYCLWTTGPDIGKVSLALGGHDPDPLPPIATFEEFLLLYMQESERLYRP